MTKDRQVQNTDGTEAGRHRRTSGVNDADLSAMNREKAFLMHQQHVARDTTKAAREAFHQKFVDDVDAAGALPDGEREERAREACRVYMRELAKRPRRRAGSGPIIKSARSNRGEAGCC